MTESTSDPPLESPSASHPDSLPTWEIIALGLGDALMLIIFAAIGRGSHQMGAQGSEFVAVINAAMPFVTAWIIVGVVVGVYSGKAMYPLNRVIGRTLLAGIIAGPSGVLLRTALLGRWPAVSFYFVATGFNTLFLLLWRAGWSRLRRLWWPELP